MTMVSVANDIFVKSVVIADSRNDEVVYRAILESQVTCCGYVGNEEMFATILAHYVRLKVLLTKTQRDHYHGEYNGSKESRSRYQKVADYIGRKQGELNAIREKMKKIYPCQKCISRYNPTNKATYKGKSVPRRISRW